MSANLADFSQNRHSFSMRFMFRDSEWRAISAKGQREEEEFNGSGEAYKITLRVIGFVGVQSHHVLNKLVKVAVRVLFGALRALL